MAMEERAADRGDVMPPTWPYYTTTWEPTVYRDVTFQVLFFEADDAVVAALLPSPLEPAAGRPCVIAAIDVPYASSYGPFRESFLLVPCTFRGAASFYVSFVFLNNVRAICAGREIWGTPKVFAEVAFERQGERISSRTVFEGHPLIETTTTAGRPVEPTALPPMFPAYRLKLIPAADGRGLAVKQLVTAEALDVRLSGLTGGEGRVLFGAGAGLDLTGLGPRKMFDAFTFVMSYRETFGVVAHDYLKG